MKEQKGPSLAEGGSCNVGIKNKTNMKQNMVKTGGELRQCERDVSAFLILVWYLNPPNCGLTSGK